MNTGPPAKASYSLALIRVAGEIAGKRPNSKGLRMTSPVGGYVGGKSRLAKQIIAQMPSSTAYVEVFCGAAWVFFRKEPCKVEVINDMNRDLVTLYRVLQNHPEEFVRQFKFTLLSRAEFERFQRIDPDTMTDIQRAMRFYYLQKMSFGGRVVGRTLGTSRTSPPRLNPLRIEEDVVQAHQRLARVFVECLPYADVVKKYDAADTFFYLDPPYWASEKMYGKDRFSKADFTTLATLLAGLKGRFLMSLNDVPEIREIFAAFKIKGVTTRYTLANNAGKQAKELFISNY